MRKLAIVIALITFVLLPPVVAHALAAPDSMSVQSVKAFRNLAETGDMAIVFHYRIEYGSYPDTPATDSIIFRLFSSNGTLLAVSRPYVFSAFETNGYGDGVSSFYFPNGEAPAWGGAYQVNIIGVPAYYNPAPTMTYTLTAADYSTANATADSQADLYNEIMLICDTFVTVYPEVELKATTDTGMVLSSYGESYFRGAVPGIQTMCPGLFLIQTYVPEKMEVDNYDMSLQTTYTGRLQGTDIKTGADRLGAYLGGMSGYFILGALAFAACIGICIFCMRKGLGLEPGLMISIGVVVLGALLVGDLFFTLSMVMGLVAGMGIMFVFAFKRA